MTPKRVKRLIECYGADVRNWPQDERARAAAVMAADKALQHTAAAEVELDAALEIARRIQPVPDAHRMSALRERVLAQVAQPAGRARKRGGRWFAYWGWPATVGAAAAWMAVTVWTPGPGTGPAPDPVAELGAEVAFEQWAWREVGDEPAADDAVPVDPVQMGMLAMGFVEEEL